MKCPNCHCEMGSNVGICQYCGFDLIKYYERTNQRQKVFGRDYEKEYWEERRQSEKYKGIIWTTLLTGILVLDILQIIIMAFIYH